MNRQEKVAACAELAHEANRLYCRSIGDESQPSWVGAEDWARESAIKGVEGVLAGNTPEQSHESWLQDKAERGWVYGEVKNPDANPPTHPCFVPYHELPPEQQAKDQLYVHTVRGLAAAIGLI